MPDPLPHWSDSPSTSSPLDAANLNEYTTAVADNQTAITTLQSNVSTLTSSVTTLQSATNVNSVTAADSSITVAGTATAPTVAVAQSNLTLAQSQVTGLPAVLADTYAAGGGWAGNVYGTQFENTERDDVTGSLIMASGARTWLVLLGLCPASTYASFKLYLSTAATGTAGVYTCALYSASSLTNTSWARLGSGNVTLPSLTGSPGIVSTTLAFTLSSPAYVALEMVVTTAPGTLYPTFAGTPVLGLTGGSTFLNPASGCPVFGTLAATTAPASTLNPTTGFTNIAQKIWCALA